MKKKGEITVAKLVTIILAAVVLVLVIVGVSTGALKPLEEKIGSFFNKVNLFFTGNLPDSGNCQIYSGNCPGGCIKIDNEDVTGSLSLCKDACYLVVDKELVKINKEDMVNLGQYQNYPGYMPHYNDHLYQDYPISVEREQVIEKDGEFFRIINKLYKYEYKTSPPEIYALNYNYANEKEDTFIPFKITTDEKTKELIKIYEEIVSRVNKEGKIHEEIRIYINTRYDILNSNYKLVSEFDGIEYSVSDIPMENNKVPLHTFLSQYNNAEKKWEMTSPYINAFSINKYKSGQKTLELFQEHCK